MSKYDDLFSGVSFERKQYIAQRLLDDFMDFESEPGAFYYMCKMMGAKNVFVREIFDLQRPLPSDTYGIIFLFDYGVKPNMKRAKCPCQPVRDDEFVNNIFFSRQVADDSCATNAMLCCLLNNDKIDIGSMLEKFKLSTHGMSPTEKGTAIKNDEVLRFIHNIQVGDTRYYKCKKLGLLKVMTRSMKSSISSSNLQSEGVGECEVSGGGVTAAPTAASDRLVTPGAPSSGNLLTGSGAPRAPMYAGNSTVREPSYHYSCFIPIGGRLYELDGMDKYPIDYGPHDADNWTVSARQVIGEKVSVARNSNAVLMLLEPSVLADAVTTEMSMIEENIGITLSAIQQRVQQAGVHHLTPLPEQVRDLNLLNCVISKTSNQIYPVVCCSSSQQEGGGGGVRGEWSRVTQGDTLTADPAALTHDLISDAIQELIAAGTTSSQPEQSGQYRIKLEAEAEAAAVKVEVEDDKKSSAGGEDAESVERVSGGRTDGGTIPPVTTLTITELVKLCKALLEKWESMSEAVNEENTKVAQYRRTFTQRTHDYTQFFTEYFACLAEESSDGTLEFLNYHADALNKEISEDNSGEDDVDDEDGDSAGDEDMTVRTSSYTNTRKRRSSAATAAASSTNNVGSKYGKRTLRIG